MFWQLQLICIVLDDEEENNDETASFEQYLPGKEEEEDIGNEPEEEEEENNTMEQDSIWQQHLEQLETFEKLHQELETHYFSDLSSANTSAFSYKRPTSAMAKEPRKVVTFPDQSQLSIDST